MSQTITPTEHEKAEWSRLATAAYRENRNDVGHRYSVAASLPRAGTLALERFDELQGGYRAWLTRGEWPVIAPAPVAQDPVDLQIVEGRW